MPNIKSAIKRVSIIEKKTLKNNMIKSEYKTAVKNFEVAILSGNKEEATSLLNSAVKKIDGACSKGIIKKNTASRKKSNLAKKLNSIVEQKTVETKPKAKPAEKVEEEPVKTETKTTKKAEPATKKTTTTAKKTTTKTATKAQE